MYYSNKIESLRDIFGTSDVHLVDDEVRVGNRAYPIIDDVIILMNPNRFPPSIRQYMEKTEQISGGTSDVEFAEDIQFTFSEEWKTYAEVLPEHKNEFEKYFDIVNLQSLSNFRVCDLGCGIGRWSYHLQDKVRELVLVDFSDAVFYARKNLKNADNVLYFMGDLRQLPFRDNFADFLFCLGVLHHLPVSCLQAVRDLKPLAPRLLIYLYYSLDNRPVYFRFLLFFVTLLRNRLMRIKNSAMRQFFTWILASSIYMPLILLGRIMRLIGAEKFVPLYEEYHDKSFKRIRQDVYDRFFTRIEQRVGRKEIMELRDIFQKVNISNGLPYWHFLCESI